MPSNAVSIIIQAIEKGTQVIPGVAKKLSNLDKAGSSASKTIDRLGNASAAYSSTLQRLNPVQNSFLSVVGKLGALFGATQIVKGIIDTAASFERYETALTTITGSSEEAKKSMDWITEFTAKTPYELGQVTDAFVKLASRGYNATEILGFLGDTASSMGKTLDETVEAFTDAATGEFERLKEFGIRASVAGDQVTLSWMQNGKLITKTVQKTQQDISKALEDIWTQRFGGGMARFMGTFTGLFSNLKDQLTLFFKQIADAGAFDTLKRKISDMLASIEGLARSGKLNEWASQLSKTLVSLMDAAGQVGKVLAAIGMAIAPYLPALLQYGAYLLAIKAGLSVIIGLPMSIYAQIAALNNAFTVMTGLPVVEWLGGVRGAFLALGLVFATGFAIERIAKLIGLMQEMADVKKAAQAASEKYRAMANEFQAYKDFEAKGRRDLMLMEDEELRHYHESLQKKLAYWNRYRASLEADGPSDSAGLPEAAGVTGIFDTGELDAWKGRMDEANEKISAIQDAMGELGDVARTNRVDLDNHSGALDRTGSAAEGAAEKLKLTEQEFKRLKETISKVSDEFDKEKGRADQYYRFAAERAQALAKDEDAAAKASFDVAKEKKDFLINAAYEVAQKQLEILNQSNADEQQRAEIGKRIAEGLKNAKIASLQEWQSYLQGAYTDAIAKERAYHDEVIRLQNDLKAARQSTEDKIRELQRQTMSAEQAWNDKRAQAYETLARAQEELSRASTTEGLEKAKSAAEQAQQQFQALAGEVKNGDQTVVSLGQSIDEATKGLEASGAVIEQAIQKQIQLAEQSKEDWSTTAATIQQELDRISQTIDQLNETTIHPTAEIKVDSKAVDAKLAELHGKVTESTHIIHVVEVQGKRLGGLIQRFASGGWARIAGRLAGFGGGDRIRALLEAGEFVLRKEAVQKYGVGLFNMFNRLKVNAPHLLAAGASQVAKMQTGGLVAGMSNLMVSAAPQPLDASLSASLTGGLSGGSGETFILDLRLGDVSAPFRVIGSPSTGRDMVMGLEKELARMRLTRGVR